MEEIKISNQNHNFSSVFKVIDFIEYKLNEIQDILFKFYRQIAEFKG